MNQIVRHPPHQQLGRAVKAHSRTLLSDGLLARIRERAAAYDRDNRFFHEDLEDLRQAGYLALNVPKELGGAGFTLPEFLAEQARLASTHRRQLLRSICTCLGPA